MLKQLVEKWDVEGAQALLDYIEGNYTTTPPTKEGWYWILCDDEEIIIVQVVTHKNILFVTTCGKYEDVKLEDAGFAKLWIGPLPIPSLQLSEKEKIAAPNRIFGKDCQEHYQGK